MSAQLLELLFFAVIAFLIINKLLSTLGTTSDDDPAKNNSYFGEKAGLKDVSSLNVTGKVIDVDFHQGKNIAQSNNLKDLIMPENSENIVKGMQELQDRMPSFKPENFVKSAKAAFKMILEAATANPENLTSLVDKRFIEQFKTMIANYGNFLKSPKLNAKIADIYMFGNNMFIKILFTGRNVTSNIDNLKEEWTFSKSLIAPGPDWYLTNIDKV